MTIRSDSWSSTTDVKAMTRHLLDSQTTFNSTTRPTLAEVEGFIDEASGILNLALRRCGFNPATVKANSTATQAMDNWVRFKTVSFVNLVSPYQGFNAGDDNPAAFLSKMSGDAYEFVMENKLGLINASVAQTVKASDGLQFTGMDSKDNRTDRDDTTIVQPVFERNQFDNTGG